MSPGGLRPSTLLLGQGGSPREWGKNNFCFFQTAETGSRTPNSGVKGSGANHHPRAPVLWTVETMYQTEFIILFWNQADVGNTMWLVNTPSKHETLTQCWPTICDAGPASNQHWYNASCFVGCVQ